MNRVVARWTARLGQHPPLAVCLALVFAGLVAIATTPVMGNRFANAIAPLLGALVILGARSQSLRTRPQEHDDIRNKVVIIILSCVFLVALILIVVPAHN